MPVILGAILAFLASICAVYAVIESIKAKGHTDRTGFYWFIGLCGSVFMIGFVAAALPDLREREAFSNLAKENDALRSEIKALHDDLSFRAD